MSSRSRSSLLNGHSQLVGGGKFAIIGLGIKLEIIGPSPTVLSGSRLNAKFLDFPLGHKHPGDQITPPFRVAFHPFGIVDILTSIVSSVAAFVFQGQIHLTDSPFGTVTAEYSG